VRQAASDDELAAFTRRWLDARAADDGTLSIRTVPGLMRFAPAELRIAAGRPIRIRLENPDLMAHNLVLCAPAGADVVGARADQLAATPDGLARQYVPDSPAVLGSIRLLDPGATGALTLERGLAPGAYPYLCTFPGHWRVMRGVLIVE
jgi:azurin